MNAAMPVWLTEKKKGVFIYVSKTTEKESLNRVNLF